MSCQMLSDCLEHITLEETSNCERKTKILFPETEFLFSFPSYKTFCAFSFYCACNQNQPQVSDEVSYFIAVVLE